MDTSAGDTPLRNGSWGGDVSVRNPSPLVGEGIQGGGGNEVPAADGYSTRSSTR